jgi:hypothetical protein
MLMGVPPLANLLMISLSYLGEKIMIKRSPAMLYLSQRQIKRSLAVGDMQLTSLIERLSPTSLRVLKALISALKHTFTPP